MQSGFFLDLRLACYLIYSDPFLENSPRFWAATQNLIASLVRSGETIFRGTSWARRIRGFKNAEDDALRWLVRGGFTLLAWTSMTMFVHIMSHIIQRNHLPVRLVCCICFIQVTEATTAAGAQGEDYLEA